MGLLTFMLCSKEVFEVRGSVVSTLNKEDELIADAFCMEWSMGNRVLGTLQ